MDLLQVMGVLLSVLQIGLMAAVLAADPGGDGRGYVSTALSDIVWFRVVMSVGGMLHIGVAAAYMLMRHRASQHYLGSLRVRGWEVGVAWACMLCALVGWMVLTESEVGSPLHDGGVWMFFAGSGGYAVLLLSTAQRWRGGLYGLFSLAVVCGAVFAVASWLGAGVRGIAVGAEWSCVFTANVCFAAFYALHPFGAPEPAEGGSGGGHGSADRKAKAVVGVTRASGVGVGERGQAMVAAYPGTPSPSAALLKGG